MIKITFFFFLSLLITFGSGCSYHFFKSDYEEILPASVAETSPLIKIEDLRQHIDFLASGELEGRYTGSRGEKLAADYASKVFNRAGLLPHEHKNSYLHKFSFSPNQTFHKSNMLTVLNKEKENPHSQDLHANAVHAGLSAIPLAKKSSSLKQKISGKNVIAQIPASDSNYSAKTIVLGAHFDHLGYDYSMSLAEDKGLPHYGADDNASGTAAVLEICESIYSKVTRGELVPKRALICALWSGEELGTLGSSTFVKSLSDKTNKSNLRSEDIVAYVNLDMVGRLDKKLSIMGIGSSPKWKELLQRESSQGTFALAFDDDSFLPTDSLPFYLANIPVISAFTGLHEDYHKPSDTPDKINYLGLLAITNYLEEVVIKLLTSDEEMPFTAQTTPSHFGSQSSLGVYLGTIPDYTSSDVSGLGLSGVKPKSPAEQAGLKAGDIVTTLGGSKVTNIYDYTHAISNLTAGVPVPIVILRDNTEMKLIITPVKRGG